MSRRQYQNMDNSSGVGVLDKAAVVLGALEAGPATLAGLVQATGLARPTAHRLAVALEHHRLVARDLQGRFVLGPRLGELAAAAGEDRLLAAAGPVLAAAARHHRRERPALPPPGRQRICVAAAERLTGLRDTVPVGCDADDDGRLGRADPARLGGARAAAPRTARRAVHRDGPVRRPATRLGAERRRARGRASRRCRHRCAGPSGRVVAAVSVSGPIERLTRTPGRLHAPAVLGAANAAHRGAAPQSLTIRPLRVRTPRCMPRTA